MGDSKEVADSHLKNQKNPNNDAYWRARRYEGRPDNWVELMLISGGNPPTMEDMQSIQSLSRGNANPFVHTTMGRIDESSKEIKHELIDALGHSTNTLIVALMDNQRNSMTRENIRESIELHKKAILKSQLNPGVAKRIRDGKESINFWIDRLCENGILIRVSHNPTAFRINLGHELLKKTRGDIFGFGALGQLQSGTSLIGR